MFLPHVTDPGATIPVVIYGHGSGDSQFGAPTAIASTLAKAGFATVAMDVMGHGFGPGSFTRVRDSSGEYTSSRPAAACRSVTRDDSAGRRLPGARAHRGPRLSSSDRRRRDGVSAEHQGEWPRREPGSQSHLLRRPVIRLVRRIPRARRRTRIKKAVINVGGDSAVDTARLAYGDNTDRDYLAIYNPTLLGIPQPLELADPEFDFYYPYRDKVNLTPQDTLGVSEIQRAFEVADWVNILLGPRWRMRLISGASPTLFQFGWGDLETSNVVESNLVRAFADPSLPTFATLPVQFFRFDLALASDPHLAYVFMPGAQYSILPHRYLANPSIVEPSNADELQIMLEVQGQAARFFKSGTTGVLPPFFQNLSLATLPTTRNYTWPIQVSPAP